MKKSELKAMIKECMKELTEGVDPKRASQAYTHIMQAEDLFGPDDKSPEAKKYAKAMMTAGDIAHKMMK
jgi:hypothetical protein